MFKNHIKEIKKRWLIPALLLVSGVMIFILTAGSIALGEDESEELNVVDGHVKMYEWTKLKSIDDLKAYKGKGWYKVLFAYTAPDENGNGDSTRWVMNGEYKLGYKVNYTVWNQKLKKYVGYTKYCENYILASKAYNVDSYFSDLKGDKYITKAETASKINMWINVYDENTYKDNKGYPICYISNGTNGGDSGSYLLSDSNDNAFELGNKGAEGTQWTIKTYENDTDNFLVFNDVHAGIDKSWQRKGSKGNLTMSEQSVLYYKEESYRKFSIYIGKEVDYDAVTKSWTIQQGNTARINGRVVLQEGAKITVEKGGILIIDGTFLNNGDIDNEGTVVVQNGACVEPFLSSGGSIECNGGDIIIENGGKMLCSNNLNITGGGSIVNDGLLIVTKNLTLTNSLINNKKNGIIYEGYDMSAINKANAFQYDVSAIKNMLYYTGNRPYMYSYTYGTIYVTSVSRSKFLNSGTIYRAHDINISSGSTVEDRNGGSTVKGYGYYLKNGQYY